MKREPRTRATVVCSIAVAGSALLVALGGQLLHRDAAAVIMAPPSAPREAGAPATIVIPRVPLAPAAPESSRYVLGAQRAYTLELRLETTLAASPVAANKATPAMELEIKGTWSEAFIGGDERTARYRVALVDPKVFAGGPEPRGDLGRELAIPFFVERDYEGAIQALYFERGTGAVARGILKTAVALRQVAVRPGREWTTKEQDPTGEYEARYARGDDSLAIQKVRVKYTRLSTARGLRQVSDVGSAEIKDRTRIRLTAQGDLESLASTILTEVQVGKDMPRVEAKLVGSFVFRDRRVDASSAGDFDRKRGELERVEMITMPAITATADAQRESDEQTVGPSTLVDMTKELARLPVEDEKARADAMARLRADFRLRPEDTARAIRFVQAAPVEDGKAMTAALGGAGTAMAQRALVGIVDDPRTALPVRLNASAALLLLEHPAPEIVAELERQLTDPHLDIRGASSLALGAVVRKLGDDAKAARAHGLDTLTTALAAAQTPAERALGLRALGNSGDPRVVDLARLALEDPSAEVRIAAVNAVRFVPAMDADDLLRTAMLTDADPHVRRKAVDTVTGYRFAPAYFQAFQTILSEDDVALVRRAVAQSLAKVRTTPEATELLTRAAMDVSEDVRVAAHAVLSAPSAPAPTSAPSSVSK